MHILDLSRVALDQFASQTSPFPLFCPDLAQMQCIRAYVAQQPDELSLEKADVILVHQDSSDSKSITYWNV